ncbi:MAG: aldehyde dehydrogenase family protein [Alphaproteobacteria bacterium]
MAKTHFIGGNWQAASSGEILPVEDPSTGEIVGGLSRGGAQDVDAAVAAAQSALDGEWGRLDAADRGRVLCAIGQAVAGQIDELAIMEARDVGKPLAQARADALALARYMEFYGGAADKIHGQTIPYRRGYTVFTLREPHGVTGHIIPWNYPMQILGRSVGAALAMGNACVLKPAEEACQTALAFAAIAHDCGLPAGAFNIVTGLGEEAGAALAGHGRVHHVSFTGSVAAGAAVQAAAGRNAVPVTLELGGKSPQIVFDDADLDRALPFLVNAGIQNAGQTCSAASRILIARARYDEVAERMAEQYRALVAGPALDDHDIGPLISARQKDLVSGFLDGVGGQGDQDDPQSSAVEIVATGTLVEDAPSGGHYYPATLLAGMAPDHTLAQQEIFGPVQILLPFDDEAAAIALANNTEYGLVAGVWTRDGDRQFRMARALRAGQVYLNTYGAGGGVELPFGGRGKSGHGREKGFEALYGFSSLKTVASHHG